MSRVLTVVLGLGLTLGLTLGPAEALSLAEGAEPAEFPPTSYTADIYIDSRGCVYIRAGFSGAVTWVPRVTRSRQVVCGQTPSLGPRPVEVAEETPQEAATPTPDATSEPAPEPTPEPTPTPTPEPEAAPSNQITRTVAVTCPEGGANRNVRVDGIKVPLRCEADQVGTLTYVVEHQNGDRTRVNVAAPEIPPEPAPEPVQVAAAPVVIATPAPQAAPRPAPRPAPAPASTPARAVVVAPTPSPAPAPTPARVTVTAPVIASAPAAVATAPAIATPSGFRPAWNDGRLNPNRGPRTQAGNAQMNLVWTQTVPRRLVDTVSGRVMTARFRGIRYPTMPSDAQIAAVASGKTVRMAAAIAQPQPSTQARAPAATAARYVQVALFGEPDNARKTIARLQRLGLPVGVSKITRSGKPYQIVLAGPFTQTAALNAALTQVRSAGYSDAYIR